MTENKVKLKIIVYENNVIMIEKDGKEMNGVRNFKLECKEALEAPTLEITQDLI